MQNYFGIETEAAFQRGEWARAADTAAQVAQIRSQNGRTRWAQRPHLILARLRSLSTPRFATLVTMEHRRGGKDLAQPGQEVVLT